ncbi:RtcB family protein [Pelagihabitans pacificus]|nr:RtcB family protein [Pelagihabitans pacificus]
MLTTERIPIKLWLDDIEPDALIQARNLANLPFAFRHIPLMPDCHQGYGMPIGAILATKEVVVPNAVGVDIGCGMCAMRTSVRDLGTSDLKKVLSAARKTIPLGNKSHQEAQDEACMPKGHETLNIVGRQYTKALKQIGTLGGGNHFIEIQKGSDGYVWLMVHSGSRNLGYQVATWYNDIAVALNKRYYSVVSAEIDLAFLPLDTQEAQDYIKEMNYAIAFAFANRKLMMKRMFEALQSVTGASKHGKIINKPHNFAAWEDHFGKRVLVHRKGATRAFEDELGMIPGSQGSNSYIVRGLGNPESFKSCSHGAGRRMGRKQAQRELDLEAEIAMLDQKGVVHAIRHRSDLDEAPSSYKDIDVVMENQKDLVDIVVELAPMAVLKGT